LHYWTVSNSCLKSTTLEHIFIGTSGNKGYHYLNNLDRQYNCNISNIKNIGSKGVYIANVYFGSNSKIGNNGKSSFFPNDWSPKEVLDAIMEAYTNQTYQRGTSNTYNGIGKGIEIQMYLDRNRQIISAFPNQNIQP